MTDDKRIIIGITFRVSVEDGRITPEVLHQAVQRAVDYWEDGRRDMLVEVSLDACERIVRYGLHANGPHIRALDNDTTVTVEPFPTLKTGKYRVICTASLSEGAREGYELATRATFDTFEEAEQYASGISYSREPLILVEVERASL